MNTLSFNQEFDQRYTREQDILSAFRKGDRVQATEIKQGMTPEEISEVVSDRLIAVVKEQFDAAKKQFQEGKA
jgi:uncharacterized Fe-S cluster-containing radical SAM superfamily enzyme